jgi:HEAT repeat protein
VPVFAEVLKSDPNYRADISAVAFPLQRIDPEGKKSIPLLVPLLRDKDESVRASAAFVLARAYPKSLKEIARENQELIPIYVDRLKHDMRPSDAMSALASIGPDAKAAVPAFIDLLKKEPFNQRNRSERHNLIKALEIIDPDAAAKIKAADTPQK